MEIKADMMTRMMRPSSGKGREQKKNSSEFLIPKCIFQIDLFLQEISRGFIFMGNESKRVEGLLDGK